MNIKDHAYYCEAVDDIMHVIRYDPYLHPIEWEEKLDIAMAGKRRTKMVP